MWPRDPFCWNISGDRQLTWMAKKIHSIQVVKVFFILRQNLLCYNCHYESQILFSDFIFDYFFLHVTASRCIMMTLRQFLSFLFQMKQPKFLQLVLQFSGFQIFDQATNDQFIVVFCLLLNTIELSSPL